MEWIDFVQSHSDREARITDNPRLIFHLVVKFPQRQLEVTDMPLWQPDWLVPAYLQVYFVQMVTSNKTWLPWD